MATPTYSTEHTARYTMPGPGERRPVTVGELRDLTDALFQACTDYHAARAGAERDRWALGARRAAGALRGAVCARATECDWDQRERALDRSADLIAKALGL